MPTIPPNTENKSSGGTNIPDLQVLWSDMNKKKSHLFFVWLCCFVPLIALGRDSPTNRWRQDARKMHLEYLYPETRPCFSRTCQDILEPITRASTILCQCGNIHSSPLARGLKQQDKSHYILCLYKYQTYSRWPSQKFVFHREIDKGWISCLKFQIRTSLSSVVLWETVWWRHPLSRLDTEQGPEQPRDTVQTALLTAHNSPDI